MKKICKFVRLWIWALALWETVASYYKDENFRKNIDEAKWFNKCKVIFNNLVDINSNLFSDVKEIDYKTKYNKYKDIADTKYSEYKEIVDSKINDINEKIDFLKTEWDKLNQDKLQPLLNDVQTKYNEIIDIVWTQKEELLEKYGPELEKIQEKINKSVEEIKWKVDKVFEKKEK